MKPVTPDPAAKAGNESSVAPPEETRSRDPAEQDLSPTEGKVLPPSGPVDAPRQPQPPETAKEDEAAAQGRARADTQTESNWADGSAPQPRARNARSSLF